jgi:hypothetical protein
MNSETNSPDDGKSTDHSDNDRPGKQSGEGEAPVG